ncbi:hypothetical protein CDD82_2532 [Ophiocordyceps australis]|uniref:NAD-dependent epimerase/dehydratase domain-containing protein n=1 Tax=Ophiocordyceps australis TaxID=1399860 RepID=A0A2C5XW69_9HYPO|nr:hypothetical protein CDD82_2532 [Ophiocordyceps australis]
MIEPPASVVVTGANGFIAQHCIAALLEQGYHVVGTVRCADKAARVGKTHGAHARLGIVVVEDLTRASSYVAALGGMAARPRAILHLAAPFDYRARDFERDVMIPAVGGTRAVLEAAQHMGSVRRVVHTSSFACIYDASAGPQPGKTYTERDWSPLGYADGVGAADAAAAYRASKAAAEKAAWAFMDEARRGFDLVSLCPAMVFGPWLPGARPRRVADVNTSNRLVWEVLTAGREQPVPPTRGPVWVDVRDVAQAHVQALRVAEAGGRRLLLCQGVYCNQELADVGRAVEGAKPTRSRVPVGEPGRREWQQHFGADASEAERVLGMRWRGLRECLGDLMPQLAELG